MSAVEEILAGIDPAQLAAALGTDERTARDAAAAAIPTLIGGFQANARTEEGRSGLLAALDQHAGDGLFGDRVDLAEVDTEDGRRIVSHALAGDPGRLQPVGRLDGGLLARLLPLLAPIVLNYLARKLGAGGSPSGGSGGLGDLLGGMLGGAGGGVGDVLGGMLGADRSPAVEPSGIPSAPSSGGVFTPSTNSTGLQIPVDADQPTPAAPPQASGNVLGDLLGQILGR